MMEIILLNVQLVEVIAAIQNVRQFTEEIAVPINLKMDEMIDVLHGPMRRFENRRPEFMKAHIAQKPNGNFKTERVNDGFRYVFKSEEDEDQYLAITDKELTFDFDLLTKEEIMQLTTGKDKTGDSGHHLRHLKLVTKGYAKRPEQEPESEQKEE